MAEILTIDGKKYVRIGDKLIEVDENGQPKGIWSEETPNAQGGQDCTIHVPCLQVVTEQHKPT